MRRRTIESTAEFVILTKPHPMAASPVLVGRYRVSSFFTKEYDYGYLVCLLYCCWLFYCKVRCFISQNTRDFGRKRNGNVKLLSGSCLFSRSQTKTNWKHDSKGKKNVKRIHNWNWKVVVLVAVSGSCYWRYMRIELSYRISHTLGILLLLLLSSRIFHFLCRVKCKSGLSSGSFIHSQSISQS